MQLDNSLTITSGNQITNLDNMDPSAVRNHVRKTTLDFKNSWRNLAQALHTVFENKLYRHWGYDKFDQYTEKEVHIRKHTAMKLIRSYTFLESEGKLLYIKDSSDNGSSESKPSLTLESADILRKAKRSLGEEGYQKVKEDIIHGGKDPKEIKKDLTALIMKRRKDLNPEEERTKHKKITVNRFIGLLKAFKNEIEVLKILPETVAAEIEQLLETIKKYEV